MSIAGFEPRAHDQIGFLNFDFDHALPLSYILFINLPFLTNI